MIHKPACENAFCTCSDIDCQTNSPQILKLLPEFEMNDKRNSCKTSPIALANKSTPIDVIQSVSAHKTASMTPFSSPNFAVKEQNIAKKRVYIEHHLLFNSIKYCTAMQTKTTRVSSLIVEEFRQLINWKEYSEIVCHVL